MSHVSTKSLARYRSGDLGRRRSAAVSRHLSGCARCQELSADLDYVSAALASVQVPPLRGPKLTRIEHALAAEAAQRAAQPAGADAGPAPREAAPPAGDGAAVPGRPDLPARSRRSRPSRARLAGVSAPLGLRLLAGTGAALILAGAGFGLWHAAQPSQSHNGTTAGGPAAGQPAAGPGANARQVVPVGATVTVPYRRGGTQATVIVRSTGTNYLPGTLAAQLRGQLTFPGALSGPVSASNGRPRQVPFRAAGRQPDGVRIGATGLTSLAGCIGRIAAGRQVILVNVGYYQGQPATIIAVRSAGGSSADVWVVGASCSATQSAVIAHTTLRG